MSSDKHGPYPLIDGLAYLKNPLMQAKNAIKSAQINLANADQDLFYSLFFLISYNGSTATFNSYRRDIEKLLQWCFFVQKCNLACLKREHIEAYVRFCQAPPKTWIGKKQVARFHTNQGKRIINPDWRPFVHQKEKTKLKNTQSIKFTLSKSSLQGLFSTLSSFFNYLVQEEYISNNPIASIRQKNKYIQRSSYSEPIRRLSTLQWDYIIETVKKMASNRPEEHERTLFIMIILYSLYLRISELVADERSTPVMGDFHQDQDKQWWLKVIGKGNKQRLVSVPDTMLDALKRYRKYRKLPALPYIGENTPLISKIKGKGGITSTRQIRNIVQQCFNESYQRMKADGLEDEAIELKVATVHWLRHTGISDDVKFRPKEHVREDAGHASMVTTDRYVDTQLRDRHASGKFKKIIPE